jgi:enoyl-CoA hydratase
MDPVIHVGTRRAPRAADVAVATEAEAAALRRRIARAPLAAAMLVQLLRATERLPVMDALFAESLAYATLQSGPEYRRWLAAHRAPAPFQPTDAGPPVVMARDGARLTVELNRASNRNAISVEVRDALVETFQLVLADRTIRKVELRGRGRCFSTGGDLTEFGSVPDPATGHAIRMQALPARFLAQCAGRVEVQVHSACIGAGIELPAFARRVVAAPDAFFQLPELDFGLIPGAGGTVSIPRRIGRQRAAWLMLSGSKIAAKQALAWGLVDAISPAPPSG